MAARETSGEPADQAAWEGGEEYDTATAGPPTEPLPPVPPLPFVRPEPVPPEPLPSASTPQPAAPQVPARRRARGGRIRAWLGAVLPTSWNGARVDPGRPGATALTLVAAAAAVLAAIGVWTELPRAEPVNALPAVAVVDPAGAPSADPAAAPTGAGPDPASDPAAGAGPAAPGGAGPVASGPAQLVVSVVGKVARPGLVEVPDGARVAEVLEAAGGALPGTDLASVNLARRVVDGEQVAVGVPAAADAGAGPAAAAPGSASAGGAGPAPGGRINLNTATLEQLDTLPGVGPVTAERILAWRTRAGRFARVDQLREIEGIGERRFAQLRELVTV